MRNIRSRRGLSSWIWAASVCAALIGGRAGLAQCPITFAAPAPYAVPPSPDHVTTGDFNLDGRPDLALVHGAGPGPLSILLANPDGSLQKAMGPSAGSDVFFAAVERLDADAHPDIVAATTFTVAVFFGEAGGVFQDPTTYPVPAGARSVAVDDLNNDGRPDIVVTAGGAMSVSVLLANADATFQEPVPYFVGNSGLELAVEDLNADDVPDVVVATNANYFAVLLGNPDGTLLPPVSYALSFGLPGSVAVGLLDSDDVPDLVVGYVGNAVQVFRGVGDGTFAGPATYLTASTGNHGAAIADLDLDGSNDIAVANLGGLVVLRGSPGGVFTPAATIALSPAPVSLAAADFNLDGKPDIVTANPGGGNASVLINTCTCCCPDGKGPPTTYLFGINDSVTGAPTGCTSPRNWSIRFSDNTSCMELVGDVSVPTNASASVFAKSLAGRINQVAFTMMPGTALAGWAPGQGGEGEPDAYVFVSIYGCAAGLPCPMTLCIDSGTGSECCLPADATCPGAYSLGMVKLSGDDCNLNQLDDAIDELIGVLTDENGVGGYDQCEGHCIDAPLGFAFTRIGSADVVCGIDGAMAINAGGIEVDARGFDSFGFEFEDRSTGPGAVVRSRGMLGNDADAIRSVLSYRAVSSQPASFAGFADYAALGVSDLLVRLIDGQGKQLALATFANDPSAPLVTFDAPPVEIEIDQRLLPTPTIERRAGVFRFAQPVRATLMGVEHGDVSRVEFVPIGSTPTFGPLERVTFEVDQGPVHIFKQYFRMPDGAKWTPAERTAMSIKEGLIRAQGSRMEESPINSWVVENDGDAGASRIRLEFARRAGVDEGSSMSIGFRAVPDTPAPPMEDEPVDPLDFHAVRVQRSGGDQFFASIDLPLCILLDGAAGVIGQGSAAGPESLASSCNPVACSADGSCSSALIDVRVDVCHSGAEPCMSDRWFRVSSMAQCIGMVNRYPSVVSEGVDANGALCMTFVFETLNPDEEIEYEFLPPNGLSGRTRGVMSMTFTGVPSQSPRYARVTQVRTAFKVAGACDSEGVTMDRIGCGDYNRDQRINTLDFFEFMADFFSFFHRADMDVDGSITSQDFFAFLACFFSAP